MVGAVRRYVVRITVRMYCIVVNILPIAMRVYPCFFIQK